MINEIIIGDKNLTDISIHSMNQFHFLGIAGTNPEFLLSCLHKNH